MSASIELYDHRAEEPRRSKALTDDYLEGVEDIAAFMGWTIRKVRYARETGALPICVKHGIGLYAFKSELIAALKTPDTLSSRPQTRAG